MIIIILAAIGLAISIYGIMVERKLQQDSQYKAACDISDTISCTRPMLSPYSKMFGISNSLVCALYYVAIIMVALMNVPMLLIILTTAGLVMTIIFAYILYFKIKSLCLICISLYCINIALALICYFHVMR